MGTQNPSIYSVWDYKYPGMQLEEVKRVNPFAIPSWLNQPFGVCGSWERQSDIKNLFAGKTIIDKNRIVDLGRNKGKYVAFRSIVHDYAVWKNEELRICTKK